MRSSLFALCLVVSAASAAMAADDPPLFGSEGSGVIQITLPAYLGYGQNHARHEISAICTSQGCSGLQNAAIREVRNGKQP